MHIPLPETDRAKEKTATAVLAVARIKKNLQQALDINNVDPLRTRDIIEFENKYYKQDISSGSYDDVRRKDLKFVTEAGLVLNTGNINSQATNSPSRKYGLNPKFAELIRTFKTSKWEKTLSEFNNDKQNLQKELERKRELDKFSVQLPEGIEISLHNDAHNILQSKVITEFLPRFGFNAEVLYVGDATDKDLFVNENKLKELKFVDFTTHDKLPDIVAYSEEKNLLYLIEALHSTGPMDEMRVKNLKELLKECPAKILFFTAFENRNVFRQWSAKIAWESEVWIADNPDHLIHFNGYKFLEINK